MKYIVRSIKYFFYYIIILCVVLGGLVLIGIVDADPAVMFRGGVKSIEQIALMFAVVAAIYPKVGFCTRSAKIAGDYSQIRQGIVDYMEIRGYKLETEEGENMTFRLRNKVNAAARMLEDRVTMTRELGGFAVEGITKDVIRIIGGLEYKFRTEEES
ncbi:MAG: hypothetical protein MJY86_05655 [Bacteroidales bacterium]|nr:hypothetical protein [Candidatus Cryptobacteroides faecihippi]MCQ2162745.1 hypothetical protein [Bacteroidales bacterium]